MVSKANDDLPEPERPVNTTRRSRGISTVTSLRLCSRAPLITIEDPVVGIAGGTLKSTEAWSGQSLGSQATGRVDAYKHDLAGRERAVGDAGASIAGRFHEEQEARMGRRLEGGGVAGGGGGESTRSGNCRQHDVGRLRLGGGKDHPRGPPAGRPPPRPR